MNGHTRPFLKWAGNKYQIIDRIKQQLPEGKRLIEPFAGSGAVFLNTDYPRYLLTDTNNDLINLYNFLKKEGQEFIEYCRPLYSEKNNQEERYYALRDEFNSCSDSRRRSALFVYLNRHGYNGLCRYNKKGGYNVPFGRYKRPYFPEKEMVAFHLKAKRATFKYQDFQTTIKQAREGDVIYCDPPYVPLSPSANFTSYSSGGFDMELQQTLADIATQAAERNIPVLISNHKTKFTEEAYQAASDIKRFHVRRYISCNGNKRGKAGELLALFD
ncbi:MAG: Dam family site-specific DNA-(adenine-N6)-methyltransferase [Gammaproteobacteria bacterium]|nr:Dam family site-specific DNA-(adenine-N6)-methyltransferase [Gammaproteobacteria bacterium]